MKTFSPDLVKIKKISLYTYLLMLLTTIHHVYGAHIYNSPFRLHVVFISIPVLLITFFLTFAISRKEDSGIIWILIYSLIIIAVILFGIIEGVYNHFLKVLLFYSGVPEDMLTGLFPPPVYEMPDDFFFEFTGVLQAMVFLPILTTFTMLVKSFLMHRNNHAYNIFLKNKNYK